MNTHEIPAEPSAEPSAETLTEPATAARPSSPTPLLVLDVVGLTPVSSTTCHTSSPSPSPAHGPTSGPFCPPSPAPPSPRS